MLQVMVRETEIELYNLNTIYAVKYSKNETENYGAVCCGCAQQLPAVRYCFVFVFWDSHLLLFFAFRFASLY